MGGCQVKRQGRIEFLTKQSLTWLHVSFAKKATFRHYLQTIHTVSIYGLG